MAAQFKFKASRISSSLYLIHEVLRLLLIGKMYPFIHKLLLYVYYVCN
jgi:hypothetical protein